MLPGVSPCTKSGSSEPAHLHRLLLYIRRRRARTWSNKWVRLIGRELYDDRICYHVELTNGRQDYWPVDDKGARYEFK